MILLKVKEKKADVICRKNCKLTFYYTVSYKFSPLLRTFVVAY